MIKGSIRYNAIKWTGLIITAMMLCLSLPSHAQTDPPLIKAGKTYLLNNELDRAIGKFSQQLKIHGYNKDAYYWRAHCLIQLSMIDEAMKDLRFLLQYHANDSRAMDAMGYAFNQKGEYAEAIKWFNKAVVLDSKNPIIYNNRGMSYYYLGKFPTAFYDFNKAVHLDSTFAQAYGNRGSARYNNQNIAAASDIDLRKAEADFTKALELDQGLLSAYRNRAIIRHYLGKYRGSFLDFQKVIYLDPDDALIYFHLGNLMMSKESHKDAVTYYGECLKRDIKIIDALYGRANAYEHLKAYDLARYDYETILMNPKLEHGKAYYKLARLCALEDDMDNALYFLGQSRKNDFFNNEESRSLLFHDPVFKEQWEDKGFAKLKEKLQ
ncbi:MAG: tetratricopeptide repeat protein [Bacteroidetes bacterium]|nr:tetratricopeptide repeat protein [Bacteroidota bacterium]